MSRHCPTPRLTARQRRLVEANIGVAHQYRIDNLNWLSTIGDHDEVCGLTNLFATEAAVKFDRKFVSKRTGEPVRFSTFLYAHLRLSFLAYIRKLRTDRKRLPTFNESAALPHESASDRIDDSRAGHSRSFAITALDLRPDPRPSRESEMVVADLLRFVDAADREVVDKLYGLTDRADLTVTEVAKETGVTRTRVYLRRERAFAAMRAAGGC